MGLQSCKRLVFVLLMFGSLLMFCYFSWKCWFCDWCLCYWLLLVICCQTCIFLLFMLILLSLSSLLILSFLLLLPFFMSVLVLQMSKDLTPVLFKTQHNKKLLTPRHMLRSTRVFLYIIYFSAFEPLGFSLVVSKSNSELSYKYNLKCIFY
jgi:hypothetical protein